MNMNKMRNGLKHVVMAALSIGFSLGALAWVEYDYSVSVSGVKGFYGLPYTGVAAIWYRPTSIDSGFFFETITLVNGSGSIGYGNGSSASSFDCYFYLVIEDLEGNTFKGFDTDNSYKIENSANLSITLNPDGVWSPAPAKNVKYIDASGVEQTCAEAVVVTSSVKRAIWTEGWYVVTNDVTIAGGAAVVGDVHLILADGATLTCIADEYDAGIGVTGDWNLLTIYGQENGLGELFAAGGSFGGAGIGGAGAPISDAQPGSNITINGGKVTATAGGRAAGIGGGGTDSKTKAGGTGSNIKLNGGRVIASAQDGAPNGDAIGNGYNASTAASNIFVADSMILMAGPSLVLMDEIEHESVTTDVASSLASNKYAMAVFPGTDEAVVCFETCELSVTEGTSETVVVYGGSTNRSTAVDVSFVKNSYAKNPNAYMIVNGVEKKVKFPITLNWEKGDRLPKMIRLDVKGNKKVEVDKYFTLQLGSEVACDVGPIGICRVTVKDRVDVEESDYPYVRALAWPANGGKANGSGYIKKATATRTLRAKANKWAKFDGWYRASTNAPNDFAQAELVSSNTVYEVEQSEAGTYFAHYVDVTPVIAVNDPDFTAEDVQGVNMNADGIVMCTIEEPVSFPMTYTADPDSNPKLTVSKLPSGLKYDCKTGLVSGTPKKSGLFISEAKGRNAPGKHTLKIAFVVQ